MKIAWLLSLILVTPVHAFKLTKCQEDYRALVHLSGLAVPQPGSDFF